MFGQEMDFTAEPDFRQEQESQEELRAAIRAALSRVLMNNGIEDAKLLAWACNEDVEGL
jgi:hypothetical protein